MCFNSLAQVLQEGGCRGVELSADHPIPLRREVDALSYQQGFQCCSI